MGYAELIYSQVLAYLLAKGVERPVAEEIAREVPKEVPRVVIEALPIVLEIRKLIALHEEIPTEWFGHRFTASANTTTPQNYDHAFFGRKTLPFKIVEINLALSSYDDGDRVTAYLDGEKVANSVPFPLGTLRIRLKDREFMKLSSILRIDVTNVHTTDAKTVFVSIGVK